MRAEKSLFTVGRYRFSLTTSCVYTVSYNTMDTRQVKTWKAELDREIKSLSDKIASLTTERQRRVQQLELVSRLLESEAAPKCERSAPQAESSVTDSHITTPDEVKDRVLEILLQTGRPMNIKEIHAEFLRRSLPIPGKGTPFNILVHISREVKRGNMSRLYRTGKGTYALRQHQSPSAPPTTARPNKMTTRASAPERKID